MNPQLSSLEIESLRQHWMPGNISYYSTTKSLQNIAEDYFNKLRNHRVIEIGPGGHPINLDWPCKEYIGVQPHKCYVPEIGGENYILEDGLSFLRKQPDSSAIVVSFGVLDEDVLRYCSLFNSQATMLSEKYIKEIASEIKRVSSPYAIIVANAARDYLGEPNLIKNPSFIIPGGVYSFK